MRGAALALTAALVLMQAGAVRGETLDRVLLLEIWVNGRNSHHVSRVLARGGGLLVPAKDLKDAGIVCPDDTPLVTLAALSGVSARVDETAQRLMLAAGDARLAPEVFDLRPSQTDGEAVSARGAILNYDISASAADVARVPATASAGFDLDLAIFTAQALFRATGFANANVPGAPGARLDTSLEFDDAPHLRRIVVGDAVSGSLGWSRALRFGGVQYASDFALQPDLVTLPLPDFFGHAAVPQTVDVFSGAAQVFEANVDPGPFELRNLPIITGGGTATIVTHDLLGRETAQTIALYTTSQMLAPGLWSYDLDAGFVRRDYGVASFDYATPMAMFTVRRGIANALTLEAHGEASAHATLAGAGGMLGIGGFGAISAALAASRSDAGTGLLGAFTAQARSGPFTLFGSFEATRGRYADIALLEGEPLPSLRYQAGASASLGHGGSAALSWIGEKTRGERATNLLSASYSLSFGNGLFLGATGLRDFGENAWAGQLYISVPLGGGLVSGSVGANNSQVTRQAAYAVPADPDGGFGYRLMAQAGDAANAEADATWFAPRAQLDGAVALNGGKGAVRADASGALVMMDGSLFAARKSDGAVALVKTGAPGVRVYRENRQVALSNAGGEALLTGLLPYAANRIAVEPRDYPMTALLGNPQATVVPKAGGGVIVDLAPLSHHALVVTVVRSDGKKLPVGSLVRIEGADVPLMVGRDGRIFFPDAAKPLNAAIELPQGDCRFEVLPPQVRGAHIPQLGPVQCRMEQAGAH